MEANLCDILGHEWSIMAFGTFLDAECRFCDILYSLSTNGWKLSLCGDAGFFPLDESKVPLGILNHPDVKEHYARISSIKKMNITPKKGGRKSKPVSDGIKIPAKAGVDEDTLISPIEIDPFKDE